MKKAKRISDGMDEGLPCTSVAARKWALNASRVAASVMASRFRWLQRHGYTQSKRPWVLCTTTANLKWGTHATGLRIPTACNGYAKEAKFCRGLAERETCECVNARARCACARSSGVCEYFRCVHECVYA